mmetsp:Transcript_31313/g.99894  ORF Transcript_31313/g.99894 Transcript_31313/m.99894 type:complete len:248 (+) Transcript_31313:421-1164(+)
MTYSKTPSSLGRRKCAVKSTKPESMKNHGTQVKPQPKKYTFGTTPLLAYKCPTTTCNDAHIRANPKGNLSPAPFGLDAAGAAGLARAAAAAASPPLAFGGSEDEAGSSLMATATAWGARLSDAFCSFDLSPPSVLSACRVRSNAGAAPLASGFAASFSAAGFASPSAAAGLGVAAGFFLGSSAGPSARRKRSGAKRAQSFDPLNIRMTRDSATTAGTHSRLSSHQTRLQGASSSSAAALAKLQVMLL